MNRASVTSQSSLASRERRAALDFAADLLPPAEAGDQHVLLLDGRPVGHLHLLIASRSLEILAANGIRGFSMGDPSPGIVRNGLDDRHLAEIGRDPPTPAERAEALHEIAPVVRPAADRITSRDHGPEDGGTRDGGPYGGFSGGARTSRTLRRIRESAGQADRGRIETLAVACPKCGAKERHSCLGKGDQLRWAFHAERRKAGAAQAAAGGGDPERGVGAGARMAAAHALSRGL